MGNKQGGKTIPRHDSLYQQKNRKSLGKAADGSTVDVDLLTPQFHLADFHSLHMHPAVSPNTLTGSAFCPKGGDGSTYDNDNSPSLLSKILHAEEHFDAGVQTDPSRVYISEGITTKGGNITSKRSSPPFSSDAKDKVVKSSCSQKEQDVDKENFVESHASSGVSSSIGRSQDCSLDTDSDSRTKGRDGDSWLVDVSHITPHCMDRLEELKKTIEQSRTEKFMHFSNTGSAQLQNGADYDNAECLKAPETCRNQRNKIMHTKFSVPVDAPQQTTKTKRKAVRKLSEPWQSVHQKDSMLSKSIISGAWSKSAENSPVIVRKALPQPHSPIFVQRTPSQSPSVERRFPANAFPKCLSSTREADSLDNPNSKTCVYRKAPFESQGTLGATEATHSISRQKPAEISLQLFTESPVLFRKMPESPILLSFDHSAKRSERECSSDKTADDHSAFSSCSVQSSTTYHSRVPKSSYPSSSLKTQIRKLPLQEDTIPSSIPLCTSSTSSFSADALSTSCPTPIQFCPQLKGIPIKECILVSQPSTAVVLTTGESQENLQTTEKMTVRQSMTTETDGKTVQTENCTHSQDTSTTSQKHPSSTEVTEDTIKQNSQSAVFGSVSPKLMRQRRLLKDKPNCQNENSFSNQPSAVQSATSKISSRNLENMSTETDNTARVDSCVHVHAENNQSVTQDSQYNPSFSVSDKTDTSGVCVGMKNLGQRIRDVINESTVRTTPHGKLSSSSFGKYERFLSKEKDNIFLSSSAQVTPSSHSFPRLSFKSSEKPLHDRALASPTTDRAWLLRERRGEKAVEELKAKTPTSPVKDFHVTVSVGYSYHLNSFTDACSSHVNESNQQNSVESPRVQRQVVELTQANLKQQSEMFSESTDSKLHEAVTARLRVPGRRLVPSDTTDTLSTDRETSGSSKRESSTSTATDDTLTSFKTRSTADSADFEEGFVLRESLVFIRSANKEDVQNDAGSFDSQSTAMKRKCAHGLPPNPRTGYLHQKTRKRRRKQILSQTIISRTDQTQGVLKGNRDTRDVYSDDISDESDLFSSRDDISDFPSGRDIYSDLPSSRDDIYSDLPSSRDDISDIHKSKDTISVLPSTQTNISDLSSSIDDISDTGTVQKCVFERTWLHSPASHERTIQGKSVKPLARAPRIYENRSKDLSISREDMIFKGHRSSSHDSSDTFVDTNETEGNVVESKPFSGKTVTENLTFEPVPNAPRPDVLLLPRSGSTGHRRRLPTASSSRSSHTEDDGDRNGNEQSEDTNVYSPYDYEVDEGKQLLLRRFCSPESSKKVVLSCTIYNSSCQSFDAHSSQEL